MSADGPMVRAVVVNHDAGPLLARCVSSLLALDWPSDRLQVIVADNASRDNSLAAVPESPRVQILDNGANIGFGAAINRALAHPGPRPDAVLLLNPDARIEPDALAILAQHLIADETVGAVCPRILFDRPMATIEVITDEGMQVSLVGAEVDDTDVTASVHGLTGAERRPRRHPPAAWLLHDRTRLHVPHGAEVRLHFDAARRGRIRVAAGATATEVAVGRQTTTVTVPIDGPPLTVIQNDGSRVAPDGTGTNRHFHLTIDDPDAIDDDGAEVFAWCGAAVLLRATALARIGGFAEPLFLYYEDTDLAWRGRAAGWRHVVAPRAIVWHRHSATTGQGSPITEVHQHRNRVLMVLRNAPAVAGVRALLGLVLTVASLLVRAVGDRLGGGPGDLTRLRHRMKSLTGALALLPWAVRSRRQLGRRSCRGRREVFGELG